ncbi:hypothetical protein EZV62_014357 [Acer yangbiense]|uniref:Homeobox domain-containing protein n=1 Tax=Acer yangbiense TaxID=1000413 RepID=A0A5C7HSL1_9ROSI|nr:hypothetical protein EZV62_014357 [Acer yangbiense]
MEAHQQARWTPTPEQIGMLKDIYYNSGIRSPTPEQIQQIIARLRQYAPSSTGHFVYTAAQMGNYGSVTMEKSFRDCSISSGRDHVETLPLFPMHGGEDNFSTTYCNNKPDPSSYYSGSNGSNDGHGSSRPSLELSLNSYTSWSSGLICKFHCMHLAYMLLLSFSSLA